MPFVLSRLLQGARAVRPLSSVLSLTVLSVVLPLASACAQSRVQYTAGVALSPADSALVGRILLAEDMRLANDPAIAAGASHKLPPIRFLANRARARTLDAKFVSRDSLPDAPALRPPPVYPEAAWRLRLRALTAQRGNCEALEVALADSAGPVRFRATDLLSAECADNPRVVGLLNGWVTTLTRSQSNRSDGSISWHDGAHALVALARILPATAADPVEQNRTHAQPEVREYVARAATTIRDSATLAFLLNDASANVRALAVQGVATLSGHQADALFVRALADTAPQVVLAAAGALKGSPLASLNQNLMPVFNKWVARGRATDRDVRVALLTAMGRDASEDRAPAVVSKLPTRAVPLALGADIRVRVTMAPASGGGSFVVRMRGDVAPMMAARILDLVDAKYYDGLTWHRVEHDFVTQGGSPLANEYASTVPFMRDELGRVPHARGTVGMSTRGHDTGDGQWFFNLRDNLRLNGDYTVWAEVVSGIDVVDGILEGARIRTMRVEPASSR